MSSVQLEKGPHPELGLVLVVWQATAVNAKMANWITRWVVGFIVLPSWWWVVTPRNSHSPVGVTLPMAGSRADWRPSGSRILRNKIRNSPNSGMSSVGGGGAAAGRHRGSWTRQPRNRNRAPPRCFECRRSRRHGSGSRRPTMPRTTRDLGDYQGCRPARSSVAV